MQIAHLYILCIIIVHYCVLLTVHLIGLKANGEQETSREISWKECRKFIPVLGGAGCGHAVPEKHWLSHEQNDVCNAISTMAVSIIDSSIDYYNIIVS